MRLRWYRRHTDDCRNALAPKVTADLTKKKKFTDDALREALDSYRHCDCAIYYRGSWAGKTHPRTSLGVTDAKRADELLEQMMQSREKRSASMKLTDALNRWYRDLKVAKRSDGTLAVYQSVWDEMLVVVGQDATLSDVDQDAVSDLRARWAGRGVEVNTELTYLASLQAFFKYAIDEMDWLEKSPMPPRKKWPVKPHGADRAVTLPLDPGGGTENYSKLIAALNGPRQGVSRRDTPPLVGPRLAVQCEVMYHGGLRISDAILFEPRKLVFFPECAQYTYTPYKTRRLGKTCTTFLPLDVAKRAAALSHLSPGYPFWIGGSKRLNNIARGVRDELVRVAAQCGIGSHVRPHRFRDSFAINQWLGGADVKTISERLGHGSQKTTEEHYFPQTESRLDRAREEYIRAMRRPEPLPPNVVQMPSVVNE